MASVIATHKALEISRQTANKANRTYGRRTNEDIQGKNSGRSTHRTSQSRNDSLHCRWIHNRRRGFCNKVQQNTTVPINDDRKRSNMMPFLRRLEPNVTTTDRPAHRKTVTRRCTLNKPTPPSVQCAREQAMQCRQATAHALLGLHERHSKALLKKSKNMSIEQNLH